MNKKTILMVLLVLLFLVGNASNLFACWGARPLSMGGAFVAVADDVHSIYWNPAGLAKVKSIELTYTRWINLRDVVNYDDFMAGAFPLKYGTLGIGYTYNKDVLLYYISPDEWEQDTWTDHYVNLGYGISLVKGVSVGLNVKLQSTSVDIIGEDPLLGPFEFSDGATIIPLDFGLLWDIHPKFTFGVLCQNFNEPTMNLFGTPIKEIFNLRPGIAWKPTDKLTFALDVYDALNKSGTVGGDLRFGMEAWVTENLAVRVGAYHFNNKEMRAITGGIGIKVKGWTIDYGLMYWQDAGELQHLLGITYKF